MAVIFKKNRTMNIQTNDATIALQDEIQDVERVREFERKLIKSMAGTYSVSFKFAETFAPDKDYKYHDRKYEAAREVVYLLEDSEDKISLQHLLYIGKGRMIKHWRQDWHYENREFFNLVKGHEWEKIEISPEMARGTWTQKVFQVDDAPRYEGYGTWVHVDGRNFWESTADAALPRREITTRNDYNVLRRNSHIEIFDNGGWMIDQDNEKIIRSEDNEDSLLCMEKGLEEFIRRDYDATDAMECWERQAPFWADVRQIWSEIRDNQDCISIPDDQALYMAQFGLAEQFSGEEYDSASANTAIRKLLSEHVDGFRG